MVYDATQIQESHFLVSNATLTNIEKARANISTSGDLRSSLKKYLNHVLDLALRIQEQLKEEKFQAIPYYPVTFRDIQEYASKSGGSGNRSTVQYRANKLISVGLVREVLVNSSRGGKPFKVLYLNPLEEGINSVDEQQVNQLTSGRKRSIYSSKRLLNQIRESNMQLISDFDRTRPPITETLFTGICDRVMRFSTREVIPNNRIVVGITHLNAKMLIQATTETGASSQLAALSDQRVIRALLTEIVGKIESKIGKNLNGNYPSKKPASQSNPMERLRYIESKKRYQDFPGLELDIEDNTDDPSDDSQTIDNQFYIDVTRLAKRMGYKRPSSGQTRSLINQALRRLHETKFRIVIAGPDEKAKRQLMETLNLEDMETEHRLITEMNSQYQNTFYQGDLEELWKEQPDEEQSDEFMVDAWRPDVLQKNRIWRLKLNDELFNRLMDPEQRAYFRAHKEILEESSGIAQSIYNYMNMILGRTNQSLRGKQERVFHRPLEKLHKTIWPERKFSSFEARFIDLLRRHTPKGQFDETLQMNRVRMFGFKFDLYKKEDQNGQLYVRITRDLADPISGNSSHHNRMLAKSSEDTVQL
ncbi:hypothetical protein EZI54_07470 [Marinobacter halodurans]|uniref:Uncharacterized protein n=1 Tax=Marinobacter halodurans TaxID=2528979 RepID=A0ABY1ZR85_9GAMM|nr:hypothetical protein [Marinobacter halodurans]TBW57491.1 hypothetical protein EZI54_07470 [Marinobacter halodurans]